MRDRATPLTRLKRRRLIIAIIVIAVSIAIAAVGIPSIPSPTPINGTLSAPVNAVVRAGTPKLPGYFAVKLNGTRPNHGFSVSASVTNSSTGTNFCIFRDSEFQSWRIAGANGTAFAWGDCAQLVRSTTLTTLNFTPSDSDAWDIVVINTAPFALAIQFGPA